MLTLIQPLWDNLPSSSSLEFVSIILQKNQPNQPSLQLVQENFGKIADNFHEFVSNEILKSTQNDESFQRRWNMLVASDFSAKLWNKFEDVSILCEAIVLEWTAQKLAN